MRAGRLGLFSIFPGWAVRKVDQGTTGLLQAQQMDPGGVCPKQGLVCMGPANRTWDPLCREVEGGRAGTRPVRLSETGRFRPRKDDPGAN